MKIAVAGDSAGEGLATILAEYLSERFEVAEISRTDTGPDSFYADLSDRVAGIGVCIAANKVPGIRAALISDAYSAGKAATSNNAQIVTLGARTIAPELAKTLVDAFFEKTFDPAGPSANNVDAISRVDNQHRQNPDGE